MSCLAEFIRKHPCFLPKHPAHIFRIRVSCQLGNLIQLERSVHQKILDPLDSVMPYRLFKSASGFFLKLRTEILFRHKETSAVSSRVSPWS